MYLKIKKLIQQLMLSAIALHTVSSCAYAGALTVSSWNVTEDNGQKLYTYTFTYDRAYDYLGEISDIWIEMPEAGARSVTSFTSSFDGSDSYYNFSGNNSYWAITNLQIWGGQSIDIWLTTAAYVPTAYTGKTTYYLAHGFSFINDPILPVPVPEPSGLLALLAGLGGIGGVWLRRRK